MKEARDLHWRRNVGEKSLREVKQKRVILGHAFGKTLDDDSYRAPVMATVPTNVHAKKG